MAKPNYQFEKRQKALAKKNKQEEKRWQKLADKTAADDTDPNVKASLTEALPDGETTPKA